LVTSLCEFLALVAANDALGTVTIAANAMAAATVIFEAMRILPSDWLAFNAISEEQRHRAALSDPDAPPTTAEQLARARRVPSVRELRKKLKLTQEQLRHAFSRYRSRLGARRTPAG
jgi:hypothetical protein